MLECVRDLYDRVIVKRRVTHKLKDFIVQSDNGEFKSDAVLRFLLSVGGNRLTCCAYSPETQAAIERIWGIIHNMSSAMLLGKKLPEHYWQFASAYACKIYNNIPPSHTPKGETPRSPTERFFDVKSDCSMFKVFGCRAFAHIDKTLRRKNHNPKAVQCVFVGIEDNYVKGYLLYSPEHNDKFVNTSVIFHENECYDGSYTDKNAEKLLSDTNIPVESVSKYIYLEGTNHIDPDDGLLYKVLKVEERNYPGQGRFIVCYRGHVFPNGKVCLKTSKEAIHVRDVEEYHRQYVERLKKTVNSKHLELAAADRITGVASTRSAEERRLKRTRVDSGKVRAKKRRIEQASLVYDKNENVTDDDAVLHDDDAIPSLESFLHDESHVHRLVESAMYGDSLAMHVMVNDVGCAVTEPEPTTFKQAMKLPDRKSWKEAIEAELKMISDFGVFSEPIPLPPGASVLNQRWVFKRKRDEHGNVVKYKARLTPQGCYQTFGVDFMDTYAPVARMTTVRYVLALSVLLALRVSTIDFQNAFLNAPLTDDIYVHAPPGCEPLPNGYVYKLQRALYGLKQSPREWNIILHKFLSEECGFKNLRTEHCMYLKCDEKTGSYCLICLYVDDLIVAYTQKSLFDSFLGKLQSKFKVTYSEELGKTLGFQFDRTADGGMFMHQHRYVTDVLKRFGMSECRSVSTPADYHVRLCKTGAYRVDRSDTLKGGHKLQGGSDGDNADALTPTRPNASYREVIGCLLWLSMGTRPDITYAVSQCARYSSDPKPEHWTAVLRILRYLKGTPDYGIHYHKHESHFRDNSKDYPRPRMSNLRQPFAYSSHYFPGTSKVNLVGYSDADFANNVDDRRSITGYVFLLAGAPLSWNTMTQHSTALSTMESEYYAVCKTTQEALYLRMLCEETGISVDRPLVIKEDNKSCISFSKDPGSHKRTKHIDYRHFFVRDQVNDGEITLDYVESEFQLADLFTKAFDTKRFQFLRDQVVKSRQKVVFVHDRNFGEERWTE